MKTLPRPLRSHHVAALLQSRSPTVLRLRLGETRSKFAKALASQDRAEVRVAVAILDEKVVVTISLHRLDGSLDVSAGGVGEDRQYGIAELLLQFLGLLNGFVRLLQFHQSAHQFVFVLPARSGMGRQAVALFLEQLEGAGVVLLE